VKKRAKKAPKRKHVDVIDAAALYAEHAVKLPPRCAQCGRPPSHPHYGGGLVGGVYCTWYCAYLVHRQTLCGIFVVDKQGRYIELVVTGIPNSHVMSPSEVAEAERAKARPTLELLLEYEKPKANLHGAWSKFERNGVVKFAR
jgi:hypothetical protein